MHRLAGVGPDGLDRPEIVAARPDRRRDLVPIADMRAEAVLVDDFAHIAEDLGSRRDRCARPRLKAIAEGVEVAVGPDARITVGEPSAAEAFLRFEDDKARPRALLGQVIRSADAGNTCPDDHDVEVLDLLS